MAGKKNILLLNPLKNKPLERYEMLPSGALVLIGTMLHNLGYNVKVIHMLADKVCIGGIKHIVKNFQPTIVGITMSTYQTKCAKELSKVIKEVDKNILVVFGGPHPSALKLKIFDDFPYVDVVVIGEGEHTFLEIVEGKDLDKIQGICYKNKINGPRPFAKDLDYIPLPNLDLVGFRKNKFIGVDPISAYPSMFIMGARGCPFNCIFCSKAGCGDVVRFRKPELIIEEIKWLHEEYGAREIYFTDDTFNLNRKWAEQLMHLIIDNKLNKRIVYKTQFKADQRLVDKELLRLAKEAGFWLLFYGVENGNQQMLDSMKKSLTIGELQRAFELTHSIGLKTIGSFIIGLPGETNETIQDTFDLSRRLRPYITSFARAMPFPGTEFETIVKEKGHLLISDYDEYAPEEFVVRTDSLSKEELENYFQKIPNTLSTFRKLKHRIKNWICLRKLIIDFFVNSTSMLRRIMNLYKSLLSIVTDQIIYK